VRERPDDRQEEQAEPPVRERVVVFLDPVRFIRMAKQLIRCLPLPAHVSSPVVSGSRAASSNFCRFAFEYAQRVQPMKHTMNSAVITPMIQACCTYRSEEHTSELQSRENLVCRLLLEK